TQSPPGSSANTECTAKPGYFGPPGSATVCPANHYCAGGNSKQACPANTQSPASSSAITDCIANAGYYYDPNYDNTATKCPEKTYCVGGNKSAVNCPNNTNTGGVGEKINIADCKADKGYYYDSTDAKHVNAQACPIGTYNDILNATSIYSCTKCPQDTYSSVSASTDLSNCQNCPINSSTENETGKTTVDDCKPNKMYTRNPSNNNEMILKDGHSLDQSNKIMCSAGYYFNNSSGECEICLANNYCVGSIASSNTIESAILENCPPNTTIDPNSNRDNISNCIAKSGFYGEPGYAAQACPGMLTDTDSTEHNITTKKEGAKGIKEDCVYGTCPVGKFRNKELHCVPFNNTSSQNCNSEEIYVAGRQHGDSTTYAKYDDGMEANYDIKSIYGHNNLCVPISQICSA
ncbi:MAG: hypothetical protein ACO3LF_06960, partial [Candidatus Kariarchaeum pelagius]